MRRSKKNIKVLILEDVKDDAELIQIHLEKFDHKCVFLWVDKKEEYIEALQEFKPDIILSDFALPKFDGMQAFEILRKRDNLTPFICVTGTLSQDDAVNAIRLGATDVILKNNLSQLAPAMIKSLREKEEKLRNEQLSLKLKQNEAKFRSLVQNGAGLISIIDVEGNPMFLSENHEKVLGYELNELYNTNLFQIIHPDDLPFVQEKFKELIAGNKSVSIHGYRVKNAKSDWLNINSIGSNLLENPEVNGLVINSIDITDKVKKQNEIELNNERYRLAAQATRDMVYDWNLETDDVVRNDNSLLREFGYSKRESQDKIDFWLDRIHNDDKPKAYKDLTEALNDPSVNFCETGYRFRKADDTYAHIQDRGYIMRDNEGVAIRLIGASANVTESKNRELLKALLLEVSQALSASKSLKTSFQSFLKLMCRYLEVQLAEAWLTSYDDDTINLVASYASSVQAEQFVTATSKASTFKYGQGLPGKVWENKRVEVLSDMKRKGTFIRSQLAERFQLHKAHGMPLIFNNKVLGVLVFVGDKESNLLEQHKWLLHETGTQLAAEVQRKLAELELDNFFKLSPDVFAIMGFDGFLKKVNPEFSNILGYSEQELLVSPIKDFLVIEDTDELKKEIENLENSDTANLELRLKAKSGELILFSWKLVKNHYEKRIYAVGRDITEQKKTEKLLFDAQNTARIGAWEVDLVKDKVVWSSVTKEIHEVADDYVPDLSAALNFYKEGESRNAISKASESAIEKGKAFNLEAQITTFKGNDRWIRVTGNVELENKKPLRLFGGIQDITARKRAELQLIDIKNNRESIINSTDDLIFSINTKLKLVAANTAYKQRVKHLFNIELKEGESVDILHNTSQDIDDWKAYLDRALKGEKFIDTKKDEFNGEVFYSLFSFNPIFENGKCVGTACFVRDITERTKHLQEIEERNAKLMEIAWIQSHVIRAPLTRIMGLINVYKEYKGGGKSVDEIMQLIADSANELDDVIHNITEKSSSVSTFSNMDNSKTE